MSSGMEKAYMKAIWGYTYVVACERPKQLYFDERYWTPKDIRDFFTDLQVCDNTTWEKCHRRVSVKAKFALVEKRIKKWLSTL